MAAIRLRERPGNGQSNLPHTRGRSLVRDYVEVLVGSILLALVVRAFIFQAFTIPSGSMLPTLKIGDDVLVNKFLYYFQPIQRDDVIVFKYPRNEELDFVKRVIGLPGDKLEIRGHEVLVNGTALTEPYAIYRDSSTVTPPEHFGPVVIPPHHLFMMGDNRDQSLDSRAWGFLDESKIVGKAFVVYFSVRTDALPQSSFLLAALDVLEHPSWIRWGRIGHLIH